MIVGAALYVIARIDRWRIPRLLKPGSDPNARAYQRMGRIAARIQPWEQRIAEYMMVGGLIGLVALGFVRLVTTVT